MKLKGSYKNRHKRPRPQFAPIIQIECPGCGWKSQPNKTEPAECEYVLHLNNVHHGVLDCFFCDPARVSRGLRLLPDFATLAAHCKNFHPKIIQELVTDGIWKSGQVFKLLHSKNEGEMPMSLARPVTTNVGGIAPRTTNWLRDTDVSEKKQKVTIVDARADETGRSAVILKLKLASGIRLDSLKTNNPNFKILFDAFGEDEAKWKGKTVSLFLEYDQFTERNWRRYSPNTA